MPDKYQASTGNVPDKYRKRAGQVPDKYRASTDHDSDYDTDYDKIFTCFGSTKPQLACTTFSKEKPCNH